MGDFGPRGTVWQYVRGIFHVLMGPVRTVHGPSRSDQPISTYGSDFHGLMDQSGQSWSVQTVLMADRISISVRTGHFSRTDGTSPDSPWSVELNPSIQDG